MSQTSCLPERGGQAKSVPLSGSCKQTHSSDFWGPAPPVDCLTSPTNLWLCLMVIASLLLPFLLGALATLILYLQTTTIQAGARTTSGASPTPSIDTSQDMRPQTFPLAGRLFDISNDSAPTWNHQPCRIGPHRISCLPSPEALSTYVSSSGVSALQLLQTDSECRRADEVRRAVDTPTHQSR